MAKKQAVESVATEIDLTPYYQRIDNATSLDDLKQIGADIAALNLGEPAKSEIGEASKPSTKNLKKLRCSLLNL